MSVVVVLGATSGIGEAIAREFARRGFDLVLAGRDVSTLEVRAKDLAVRFQVEAWIRRFDALDLESHPTWLEDCEAAIGNRVSGVVACYGVMADEAVAAAEVDSALAMIDVNYRSVVSIFDRAVEHLEGRDSAFLCAVTSVAGDRGRASNYHYGSTKAALSTYLSGLRARLHASGVTVTDVRPGMVDTKLTYGLPGLVLLASPVSVARSAVAGILRGRDVVYAPWIWWPIMLVIRLLPGAIFKRLPL